MSINYWLESVIDAYLQAAAEGADWRVACAEAQKAARNGPIRVLTQRDLRDKGIKYCRQHILRRVRAKTFPAPFNLPNEAA